MKFVKCQFHLWFVSLLGLLYSFVLYHLRTLPDTYFTWPGMSLFFALLNGIVWEASMLLGCLIISFVLDQCSELMKLKGFLSRSRNTVTVSEHRPSLCWDSWCAWLSTFYRTLSMHSFSIRMWCLLHSASALQYLLLSLSLPGILVNFWLQWLEGVLHNYIRLTSTVINLHY